ncbi:hypothetical protein glysoja_038631 [Glycine soja]|uniref:NAB domain-containing protein n=1 Tax=Glycine soja TaxID=3848 RepID=A0A0B2RQQ3_GLYSO|nr:hypothetical protein glysoja_038631 [Glycine soja]
MIKLIDEEADSFARRAEMYYKKRPELMKLVEEFYRAYRALAERYDHAMGELRHAHKTMAEAFPNQAHYMLTDDSQGVESHTPGVPCPNYSESEHAEKADSEVQTLRKALAKIQSDKDAIFLQYQKSMEKLSEMERDLNKAQKDAGGLDERASKAEIETRVLQEALAHLKSDNEASQVQYNQCLESIAKLETLLSLAQLDVKEFDERASKAEIEAKNLKQELGQLEAQKDAGLLRYKQCVEKISVLEAKITLAEENSRMLNEQLERAELEVKALRKDLAELNEEKESLAVLYHQCLEKISKMENEILLAQENSEKLNREIEKGAEKLKTSEEHCDMLEKSNQSLRLEAENLLQKIAMKDQALLEKHAEIERLQTLVHEEHSHFLEIESTLQTLQKLYSKSQQEQGSLVMELKYGLQLLKDLEFPKQGFKEEMQENVEENRILNELTFSSTRSLLRRQQTEISKLKEIKEKLERELVVNSEENNALQQEAHQIKNDIQHLNNRYHAMLGQLQTLGLDPKCFAASVKDLQNENSNLKEVCKMERNEKEALHEKSKDMDELLIENAFMEFSLSRLNDELDGLKLTVRKFLETENFMQLMEEEFLLHEIRKLKMAIHQVCGALQIDPYGVHDKGIKQEEMPTLHILDIIEGLKSSYVKSQEEKQKLLVENSVLLTSLEQNRSEREKMESEKKIMEQEFESMRQKNAMLQKEKQDVAIETCLQEELSYQSLKGSESSLTPDGVADLLSMQTRIRVVEEFMMEELERRVKKESLTANVKAEAVTEMNEHSNLEVGTYPEIDDRKVVMKIKKDNSKRGHNAWRTKSQKRLIMIDIPLDDYKDDPDFNKYGKRDHTRIDNHMLELCETDQHDVTEENKQNSVSLEDVITCHESERCQNYSSELETEKELGVDKLELWKTRKETTSEDSKRKILERLASDSQRLAILKMTLQDLKKKPETQKKSSKVNEIEYETVKRHIEDVEEAVMKQIGIYDQLAKDTEECTSSSSDTSTMQLEKQGGQTQRKKLTEQARRGSEQIGRLQFEVQNIQYILLKLADVKNNKCKNKNSRPAGVLLKDFIRIGRKNSRRRRKGCVCGCSRPSTNED